MVGDDQVPRFARAFVGGLVALILASAAFLWEPWPFTSFRLFSHLRTDEQNGWEPRARIGSEERAYDLDGGARGLRHFGFVMAEFEAAGQDRRDELCRTWISLGPELAGSPVDAVRLYRLSWRLSDREGDRGADPQRELAYVCTENGARDG